MYKKILDPEERYFHNTSSEKQNQTRHTAFQFKCIATKKHFKHLKFSP